MGHTKRSIARITVLVVAGLSMAACSKQSAAEEATGPATVEAVDGSELSRVTLTEDAAKRIDLQTAPAEQSADSIRIPYASVLYDPSGKAWAFVKSGDLTFVRAPITIDHIEGDFTFLSDGPAVGTDVVTTGANELYGAEQGVGEDE